MPWLEANGLLPGRGIPATAGGRLGVSVAGSAATGSAALVARSGFAAAAGSASSTAGAAGALFALVAFFGASG